MDVSGSGFTVTLPTAPADKTRIGIKIVANASTPNTLTIARGGTDVFNVAGGSTSLLLTAKFQGVILQYQASSGVWYVQSLDSATGNPSGAASLGTDGKHKSSEIPLSVVNAISTFATPNGFSDTAVQTAVQSLGSQGGTVKLQPGTYTFNGTVTLANNVRIEGAGWNATVIVVNGDFIAFDISGSGTGVGTHIHKASLARMRIDGGSNASWNTKPMIRCYYADTCFFEEVDFSNKFGIAFQCVELWDSTFWRCRWDGCGGTTGLLPTVSGAPNGLPSMLILNQDNNANTGFGGSTDTSNELHFYQCTWESMQDGGIWILGDAYTSTRVAGPFEFVNCKWDTSSTALGPYLIASQALGVHIYEMSVAHSGAGGTWGSTPYDLFLFRGMLDWAINGGVIKFNGSTASARTGIRFDGGTTLGSNTLGSVTDLRSAAASSAKPTVALLEYAGTNSLMRESGVGYYQNAGGAARVSGAPTSYINGNRVPSKAGVPVDGDYGNAPGAAYDGMGPVVDSTTGRTYHRVGGSWVTSNPSSTGLLSARPAASASNAGQLYFATDTNGGTLYQSTGSGWTQVGLGLSQGGGLAGGQMPSVPGLVAPAHPLLIANSSGAITANRLQLVRVVISQTGTLHDLAVFIAATSGNVIASVYDAGVTTNAVLTRLWQSGSVAAGTANTWQIVGDPALSVTAGQELFLGIQPDNTSVTFGRSATVASNASKLPYGNNAGGIPPYLATFNDPGSFAAPTTVAIGSLNPFNVFFAIVARVA